MNQKTINKLNAIDAYLSFLDTGKLLPFANVAFENSESKTLFLEAIRDLDKGNIYPYTISKLPEKLRERKVRGRPKLNPHYEDTLLTFIKLTIEKEQKLALEQNQTQLTKKQLIGIIEKADKPDSIQKFNELSQSKKYELLNSAINYETKNPDLFNAMEIAIFES